MSVARSVLMSAFGTERSWRQPRRLAGRGRCLRCVFSPCLPAPQPLDARDYKMAGDATQMRIVMNFDREPDPRWFLLRGPHRLVIDLPDTRFAIDAEDLKASGLVKGVRYGAARGRQSRG